jgi:transposase
MYFCGIDIAKRKHDVVILNEAGDIQGKPLKIPNSKTGFDDLQNALAHTVLFVENSLSGSSLS